MVIKSCSPLLHQSIHIFLLFRVMHAHCCSAGEEDETILNVQFHFAQAKVDGCIFNIGDCALIKVVSPCFLNFVLKTELSFMGLMRIFDMF